MEIRIRPFRRDDAQPLYNAVRESFEHLSPWLPWCTADYDLDSSRSWITYTEVMWYEAREFHFVVESAGGGQLLGGVGITDINKKRKLGKLGYWVRRSRVGRGIALQAALQAARYGFASLHLQRLEIEIAEGNRASRAVAEKLGAVCEGLHRSRLLPEDETSRAYCYSLVRDDLDTGA